MRTTGGITVAQFLVKRCAACHSRRRAAADEPVLWGEASNDRLEMVETVLFSVQVTISIRTSLQLLSNPAGQAAPVRHWITDLGFGLALLTTLLQLLFAAKYALAVRTLLQKQAADGHERAGLLAAPSFLGSLLDGGGAQGGGGKGPLCEGCAESAWRVGQRWDRFADRLDAKVGWSPGCRKLPLGRLKVSRPARPHPTPCSPHSYPDPHFTTGAPLVPDRPLSRRSALLAVCGVAAPGGPHPRRLHPADGG